MDGREDRYNWTQSYLDSNLAVLVAENSPDKSVEGFQGPGGVAVRAGSSAAFGIHTTETGEFSFEKSTTSPTRPCTGIRRSQDANKVRRRSAYSRNFGPLVLMI